MGGYFSGLAGGLTQSKDKDDPTLKDYVKKWKASKSGGTTNSADSGAVAGLDTSGGGVDSYKKGGKVKKTGLAKLHKGERVLNKKQTKKYDMGKKGGK